MKDVKVRQWFCIIIPTSLHKEKEEQQCRTIMVLLEACLPQHLLDVAVKLIGITSAAVDTAGLLIGTLIITIIVFPRRGIVGVDGGS
jgi:hypothetical protein